MIIIINYTENDRDKYELGSISATILNAKHARVLSSIHFNNYIIFEPSHAFNNQPFHSFPQVTPAIKPSATILLCVDATPAC